MKFLLLFFFISSNIFASELVSTFDDAKGIAQELKKNQEYKDHQSKFLVPYYAEKSSKVLQKCFASTEKPDASSFEMVIAIRADGFVEKVYRDKESNIGICMFKKLEQDRFPKPIISPYYFHITMSFTK